MLTTDSSFYCFTPFTLVNLGNIEETAHPSNKQLHKRITLHFSMGGIFYLSSMMKAEIDQITPILAILAYSHPILGYS
ncbi:hypothetical protein N1037_07140 [Phaeobacter sp. G2]|nr:hypothetical protein N1037_07140 [Phaeobacter sp. G2]